jgi:hypothetical protein
MEGYLEAERRFLLEAYRRYLRADRALQAALAAAVIWFPERAPRKTLPIGNPGSRMRRLHERRDRALARLMLARQELARAHRRALRGRVQVIGLIAR